MKTCLFVFALLVVSAVAEIEQRIAGGSAADIEDFPYLVSLQKKTLFGRLVHFCAGSIISSEWILTAAHCLKPLKDLDNLYVVAGRTYIKSGKNGQTVQSAGKNTTFLHELFKGEVRPHDIAVFKLKSPLNLNGVTVQSIALPKNGSEVIGEISLGGWGSTRYFLNMIHSNTADQLRHADYQIMNINICRLALTTSSKILTDDANFCAEKIPNIFAPPSGACNGDSGGPVTRNNEVVGIVSWGMRACGLWPTVYTKVSSYVDNFIRKHVPGV